MRYRALGNTDVQVSEIGFGCWTMGGRNWVDGRPNGWADVDEDEVVEGIKVGLDAGVNHFDNADVYGNGRAERMLARAFDKLGVPNTRVVIASKVGHFPGTAPHSYAAAHIRHQCEQSLLNLKRDALDVYYFHHGDFGPDDRYLPEAVETMDRLVEEGKVRAKGQSAYSNDDFLRVVPHVRPAVLQSWANALDDRYIAAGSPVQKLLVERGISFVAFSPLAQGLLLDKYDPSNPPTFEEGDHRRGSSSFGAERLGGLKPKLAALKARFGETTEDLAGAALGYVLAHPWVCSAIPGFRNSRQARCNVARADRRLSPEDVGAIQAILG
ncbi:MAG: aldo/keto reductase [Fimbriimonadaceae bacterium]|nr:aldo/keto reductase [Fimbriimonadaceae bacterium]